MNGSGAPVHRRGDYIWGSFVRSPHLDGWIKAIDPGSRDEVTSRYEFGLRNVDDAVGAARRGAQMMANSEIEARAAALISLAARLEEASEDLADRITRETGKPRWESVIEVQSAIRAARRLGARGPSLIAPAWLRDGASQSESFGHGVVGILTPWTQPLLLPVLYASAAILGGNAVVFKPSKFAPGTGQAVAEAMDRIKLPRGAFNLVQGPGSSVGARLAAHPGIDALAVAGRSSTVDAIRESNRHRPALPMHIQTGGKSAAIVLGDADLELAALEVAIGAFASAGQRHDSTARVYVLRSRFDAFARALVDRVRQVRIGYGFDPSVFMGPMVSEAHRRAFEREVDGARKAGAMPILEGGRVEVEGRRGFYVRPDIRWFDKDPDPSGIPEGPALRLFAAEDVETAMGEAASLAHRGVVSLFADNVASARQLTPHLPFGAVHINRSTIGGSLRLGGVPRGRASNGSSISIQMVRFFSPPQALLVDQRPYDEERAVPGIGPLGSSKPPPSSGS